MARKKKVPTVTGEQTSSIHVGRKIAVLRTARDLTQSGLARVSRVKRSSISEYEAGLSTPDASTLERLLSGVRFRWSSLDLAGWFLTRLFFEETLPGEPVSPITDATLLERMAAEMQEMAARFQAMARTIRGRATSTLSGEQTRLPRIEDREAARALVTSIRTLPRNKQEERLREAPGAIRWAVCEALCLESQRLCSEHPDRAVSIAKFALSLVEEVPLEEACRDKLRGIAWGHVGNGLRAKDDFQAAEHAITSAEGFWEAGVQGSLDLLEDGLIPALKASLRRDQHRFPEAEELLSYASEVARGARFKAQVAISRAKLYEEQVELEQAVAVLRELPETEIPEDDGRLLLCLRHNLADNLSKLDQFQEAKELLPEVRRLSRAVGGELDQVRLRWTEGRVAAGLGRVADGIKAFVQVRGDFASNDMGYDTALVSMELSVLYAREGRTAEVKSLARHMVPIFQSKEVHREAIAALTIFRQAVEKDQATAQLAQEILAYLRKARHNPDLQFEPPK